MAESRDQSPASAYFNPPDSPRGLPTIPLTPGLPVPPPAEHGKAHGKGNAKAKQRKKDRAERPKGVNSTGHNSRSLDDDGSPKPSEDPVSGAGESAAPAAEGVAEDAKVKGKGKRGKAVKQDEPGTKEEQAERRAVDEEERRREREASSKGQPARSSDEDGLPTSGAGSSSASTVDGVAENGRGKRKPKAPCEGRAVKHGETRTPEEQVKWRTMGREDRLREIEAVRPLCHMRNACRGQKSRFYDASSMAKLLQRYLRACEDKDWDEDMLMWALKFDKDIVIKEFFGIWRESTPSLAGGDSKLKTAAASKAANTEKYMLVIGNTAYSRHTRGAAGVPVSCGITVCRRVMQALRGTGAQLSLQYDQTAQAIWQACVSFVEAARRSADVAPIIYLAGLGGRGYILGVDGKAVAVQAIREMATEHSSKDRVWVIVLNVQTPKGSVEPEYFQIPARDDVSAAPSTTISSWNKKKHNYYLLVERDQPEQADEPENKDEPPSEGSNVLAFTNTVLRHLKNPKATLEDLYKTHGGHPHLNCSWLLAKTFLTMPPATAS